ncbi:hypothetical protein RG47T_0635 [Mucilaginibacter polytrichastri]|uniref:Uncharacterized protein n=1 Tax=Mucilaginibacter polytrichastri TaxID=1302689 RepID=A0A1Q5ZTU2_9SPHI|nr:hypothetical protein RG47T_0635 [Mucilaginibacter polytrichastri]
MFVTFFGAWLGHLNNNVYFDGLASMLIGLILIAVSAILINKAKTCCLGEPLSLKKYAQNYYRCLGRSCCY